MADRAILVVGVGRSGTSLAMQALQRLGVAMSDTLVPPSPDNPRGAFEDVLVRDMMVALARELGHSRGEPRPADWRSRSKVQEVQERLGRHLDRLAREISTDAVAIKFPLAGTYLPLWYDAAEEIGLPLSVIWATRGVPHTITSLKRSYGQSDRKATSTLLLRTGQILADLRHDTFLLPFEGWRSDAVGQWRDLAAHAGIELPEGHTAPGDLFDAMLDHGGSEDVQSEGVLAEIDRVVTGRRGRARAILGEDLEHARDLSDHIFRRLEKDGAETLQLLVERLKAELSSVRTDMAVMRRERDAASGELERATAELTELRDACAAIAAARGAELAARDDRAAEGEAELERLRAQNDRLTQRSNSAAAATKRLQQRAAHEKAAAQAAARHEQASSKEIARLRAELERLYGSVRWRFSSRLAGLYHRHRKSLTTIARRVTGRV